MKRILFAACLVALCGTAEAQQVIIGNSVTGPYQAGTNFGVKSLGFHTGSVGFYLYDIQVALGGTHGGGDGGKVTFTLNADDNGLPGAVIATIGTQAVVNGFDPTKPYTIIPAGQPYLNPNTDYWIQAVFIQDPVTNGLADWDQNSPPLAPSSPSGFATFNRYVFYNPTTNTTSTSTAYNAIVVNGSTVATAPLSSGTAVRAILTGSRCTQAIPPLDSIEGGFIVDTLKSVEADHVGFSSASGSLPSTGPRVGALVSTHNWVATGIGTPLGVGTGAARAVAFGEFKNNTTSPQTTGAVATLTGDFPIVSGTFQEILCGSGGSGLPGTFSGGSAGRATAAVYVFDADQFLTAIANSGKTMPDFLLGADTLADYQVGTRSSLSLTNFSSLSAAVIADDFVDGLDYTRTLPLNVGPGSVTVAPGQSVIVLFDISAYSPPGAIVQLIRTLKPAPGFMAGMTPVGPWTADPLVPANLTLTPAAATNPITTPVTLTATVTTAGGAPVPNTIVSFEFTGGPNAQPASPAITDAAGHASITYAGGPNSGTDQIHVTLGALQSNVADITWTSPGPLDHITLSPATATIEAGGGQPYTAQAQDLFANGIGDVTGGTVFTISPDGSCTGATCTASVVGTHTVTGIHGAAATASALLIVRDTIPPAIVPPPNQSATATSAAGAVIDYPAPQVSDAGSGVASSGCSPASGAVFPVGVTTATCTATDRAGNTGTATFTVTVTAFARAADGLLFGVGFVENRRQHHHFIFQAWQRNGREGGLLEYWLNEPRLCGGDDDYDHDRDFDGGHDHDYGRDHNRSSGHFETTAITEVTFSDDPASNPGPSAGGLPAVDTVRFRGKGRWNGRSGYSFEATAVDRGEPGRNRDMFSIVIKDTRGVVVASVSGTLGGGNIQSFGIGR